MARIQDLYLKKKFGQHFLRDNRVTDIMISCVDLDNTSSILEIGCGDGFLTRELVATDVARVWVFEIDPDWATYVTTEVADEKLTIFNEDFLTADLSQLESHSPWTVLANLPYNVTFPILHTFYAHRHLLKEGVIMVQEEVAQKIVKTGGRGYGYTSLFFQHYFEWELLTKIPPESFYPAPKVTSRLLYFRPQEDVVVIPDEPKFWKFIKACFAQPRRKLKNNLLQTHYDVTSIPEEYLVLRAQQMNMSDFLILWDIVRV